MQEQVAALRQLAPNSRAFSVSTLPACKVLRLPESAQLMLRSLPLGQRAKLERELAEVEAAMAASSSTKSISATTEEPHVQQGPQARP